MQKIQRTIERIILKFNYNYIILCLACLGQWFAATGIHFPLPTYYKWYTHITYKEYNFPRSNIPDLSMECTLKNKKNSNSQWCPFGPVWKYWWQNSRMHSMPDNDKYYSSIAVESIFTKRKQIDNSLVRKKSIVYCACIYKYWMRDTKCSQHMYSFLVCTRSSI